MRKICLGTLFLLILVLPSLFAGEAEDLALIIKEAGENNLDLKQADMAAEEAEEGLTGFFKLDQSRLTVTGTFGTPVNDSRGTPDGVDIGVSLPILTQLSLDGSINNRGEGSLSLAVSPLSFDTAGYRAEEGFQKALNQYTYLKKKTALDVEGAVLNWNRESMNLEYLKAFYQLEQDKAAASEKLYQQGQIGYQEYKAAEEAYLTARQRYYDGERSGLNSRASLLTILGPGLESSVIPSISIETLFSLIEERSSRLSGFDSLEVSGQKLKNMELELVRMEKELKVTFPVQPVLNLSVGTDLTFSSASGRASLTVSKSSLKFDERKDLQKQIALKKEEITAEKYRAALELESLKKNISITGEVLGLDQIDLENAGIGLKEAQFLFEKGERTALEVKEAELNLQSANIRVYQAALNLYNAQGQYLLLFL